MSEEFEKRTNHLFSDCERCSGKGRWTEYGESDECYNCDGLGIILTEEGRLYHEIAWRTNRLKEARACQGD